jgi:cysteinyl-tRNA synthetase
MSKSLGNVLLVHHMIESIPGEVIRLALLSAHYRQPLDWSDEVIDAARKRLDRLYGALRGIAVSNELRHSAAPAGAVVEALEDDLNTPKALSEMFSLARALNKADDGVERANLAATLLASGALLGIAQTDAEDWFSAADDASFGADEIEALIAKRNAARAGKDFAAADAIRDELSANGISIEDGPSGTRWRRNG